MNPLQLSPIPSSRSEDESASLLMEREGFVDEAVVTALLTRPLHAPRSTGHPEDLALAADDLDFAGWQTISRQDHRRSEVPPQVIDAIVRRAAPPVVEEPGLGQPHAGSHRWWIAGLAGALSTMLFALLLVTLSGRANMGVEGILPPKSLLTAKPVPVKEAAEEKQAELTDVSAERR